MMSKEIQIQLNGTNQTIPSATDLIELLQILELNSGHVAIEVNREIIKKDTWKDWTLHEGDVVEIVHFVGGGTSK